MTVRNISEAWEAVEDIASADYTLDEIATSRAGYDVYTCPNGDYICDLGNRLEINLASGHSVNIWIDEEPAPEKTETTVSLEVVSTIFHAHGRMMHSDEARLNIDHETTLSDIAEFIARAEMLVKRAIDVEKGGNIASVFLSKVVYIWRDARDIKQVSFDLWTSADINKDGIYMQPSEGNSKPELDMVIAGKGAKLLKSMGI